MSENAESGSKIIRENELNRRLMIQEHRVLAIFRNLFRYGFKCAECDRELKTAAWQAFFWGFIMKGPTLILIACLPVLTVYAMFEQNRMIATQNELIASQTGFFEGQNQIARAQLRGDVQPELDELIEKLAVIKDSKQTSDITDSFAYKKLKVLSHRLEPYIYYRKGNVPLWRSLSLERGIMVQSLLAAGIPLDVGLDLKYADFHKAILNDCNLSGLILNGCHFQRAQMCRSMLNSSNLAKANLCGVNFSDAYLVGTNIERALVIGTRFKDASIASLKGWNDRETVWVYSNIFGVNDAPEAFEDYVLSKGAVSIPDHDWEEIVVTHFNSLEEVKNLSGSLREKYGFSRNFNGVMKILIAKEELRSAVIFSHPQKSLGRD